MTNKRTQINSFFFRIAQFSIIALFIFLFPSHSPANENNRENAVVKAVRKISPAVVNISSEYEILERTNPFSGCLLFRFTKQPVQKSKKEGSCTFNFLFVIKNPE